MKSGYNPQLVWTAIGAVGTIIAVLIMVMQFPGRQRSSDALPSSHPPSVTESGRSNRGQSQGNTATTPISGQADTMRPPGESWNGHRAEPPGEQTTEERSRSDPNPKPQKITLPVGPADPDFGYKSQSREIEFHWATSKQWVRVTASVPDLGFGSVHLEVVDSMGGQQEESLSAADVALGAARARELYVSTGTFRVTLMVSNSETGSNPYDTAPCKTHAFRKLVLIAEAIKL